MRKLAIMAAIQSGGFERARDLLDVMIEGTRREASQPAIRIMQAVRYARARDYTVRDISGLVQATLDEKIERA